MTSGRGARPVTARPAGGDDEGDRQQAASDNGLAALALRRQIRLTGRGRAGATLCVEHCVLLPGAGAFVSGWVIDSGHVLRSLRVEVAGGDVVQALTAEHPRPEVLRVARKEAGKAKRAGRALNPGFWEIVATSRDLSADGLRLVAEPASGRTQSFVLPAAEDVKSILAFVQASGLHTLVPHLPADPGALNAAWRDALFRLTWLLPEGSVAGEHLEAYLEHGEPMSAAELAEVFEAGRTRGTLPPPETVSAIRESGLFDERFYRSAYRNTARAVPDLLVDYLTLGHREGRDPSAEFNGRYYRAKYLRGDPKVVPLVHYHQVGAALGYHTQPGPHDLDDDVLAQVRRWAAPGDAAEDFDASIAADRPRRAKVFAFYLPQFHAIPENDRWWGKGFTEWHNLMRAAPRFAGHYQPRVPGELGFYDLSDPGVMPRQARLALDAGIHGFCFYYYRFGQRRVLEQPIDRFLSDGEIELPFCLIWANENWTRRWDGAEDQVLLRQDYDRNDDQGLVDDIQRHFADRRYYRIDGRPVLLIYRIDVIPRAGEALERWRELWRRHGEEPLILIAQTFHTRDPRDYGADGAVEFPPHKVAQHLAPVNRSVRVLDPAFSGHIYDYEEIARSAEREPYPDFPLAKCVFPSWDNDARRQGTGVTVRGSTPARYERWLRSAVEVAERNPVHGERLVFVNAWNEWAEGAYLEPDVHYGAAYLNATARAVCQPSAGEHDAA